MSAISDDAAKALLDYLKQAVEFSKEQTPAVVHDVLMSAVIEHSLLAALGAGMFVVLICVMAREAYRDWLKEGFSEENPGVVMPFVIHCVATVASILLAGANIFYLLQALLCPRAYLIELLAGK